LRANSTDNKIVIRHAGYFIAGVGSVCHPSLIQVNGLGVTERLQMNSTKELKKVKLVLDENQLCTLLTMAANGQNVANDGHSRGDKIEIMYMLRDALDHLI
jgi:hypothetical protein